MHVVAMNTSHSIASHISGVDFGFLSSKEIKALAVTRITNPFTFDSLLHPNAGGLYDPALGSFRNELCKTCNLRQSEGCPGHCGYVELPVPVYHPSFIDQLLRLLRAKCVFCHHFRLNRPALNRYNCKLRLLNAGLILEAESLDDEVDKALKSGRIGLAEEEGQVEKHSAQNIVAAQQFYTVKTMKTARKRNLGVEETEAIATSRKILLKDLMADLTKSSRCSMCGGFSPAFRKEKSLKMFMKPLTNKAALANRKLDIKMPNPVLVLARRGRGKSKSQRRQVETEAEIDKGVADMDMQSDEELSLEAMDEDFLEGRETDTFLSASFVHAAMTLLFETEPEILQVVYNPRSKKRNMDQCSADIFFIKTLLVPPSRFRAENPGDNDSITEHMRNNLYRTILERSQDIMQIANSLTKPENETTTVFNHLNNNMDNASVELQNVVNALVDKSSTRQSNNARQADGIKQVLEKKEGLFRQNMMGKRVNFAARSVISPDPNIETYEIGVPPVFAKKLTYPEPVTNHNYYDLKQAVMNGPDKWPGAVAIETEDGQVISLRNKSPDQRLAISNQLLAPSKGTLNGAVGKKVHRHLNNGDIVIMNRQPTLHKPSMMCHRARVLHGEKTIRMHYANCNTYNADFDGDEMNMHFPQNELARAEANLIADTNHQYLSATFGKPLRGLIQDHISISVNLSSKDTFFTKEEYHELVYAGIRPEDGHSSHHKLLTVLPAILKPKPLWTGKQVISTILKNITPDTHFGLTLTSKSQTDHKLWGQKYPPQSVEKLTKDQAIEQNLSEEEVAKLLQQQAQKYTTEQEVWIKDGEFLSGILDKKQIGPATGGIVHGIYETLGHLAAGKLLSILGRVLTRLLNKRAFSCGVQDIILTPKGDEDRRNILKDAKTVGLEVAAKYVTLEERSPDADDPELLRRLEDVLRDDEKQKGLDELSKKRCGELSSSVTKTCLPDTLIKPFPKNQMQAMTGSGAKGSAVNANLISCNLGQQVLEGRRVPTMVSGKTLPAFDPFDSALRAGGFIQDRFLTGVKTPEYYFHAMAGREGLIDTAVKTARSGYLQRCLVKGMEGLKVDYDCTVRDAADGSVIQFLYGEDGLDVCKQAYMSQFKFTANNFVSMANTHEVMEIYSKVECEEAVEHNKKAVKADSKGRSAPDPALSIWNPTRYAGSMSEKMYHAVKKYVEDNPDKLLKDKKKGIDSVTSKKAFEKLVQLQYLKAIAEPGEAVGIVAAQSIGEPSTQMTLNTFHLAGHSSKNVTLGIPRLREIVMTASANIGTPMMTLHLRKGIDVGEAETFAKQFSRLTLSEVLNKSMVTQKVGKGNSGQSKFYVIRFEFYEAKEYCEEYKITVRDVLNTVALKFLPSLNRKVARELKKRGHGSSSKGGGESDIPEIGKAAGRIDQHVPRARTDANDSGEDTEEEENVDPDDMDADMTKEKDKRREIDDWEDPDDEEAEIASQASDEEPDDEVSKPVDVIDDEETDTDDEAKSSRKTKDVFIQDDEDEIRSLPQLAGKDNRNVSDFKFDPHGEWCEATIEHPADYPKILMLQFVEETARSAVIQAIPGLKSCFVDKESKYVNPKTGEESKEPTILTEGCNLLAIRDHQDVLDVNRAFTNDIAAMLALYGVEAGRACIVREMHSVFEGHSIDVDNRHLNLIADFMTRSGGFSPFSRIGMKNAVSAFMKMSFETTVGFLKESVSGEEHENLKTPSAKLVVGGLSGVGTGSFGVFVGAKNNENDKDDDVEMDG